MFTKRECSIENKVQIICPYCHGVTELPMCKVVNGEDLFCSYCKKKIKMVCE